ncbi:DNA repair-scaffolding protein-like isoform X4 [Physeter macrocephalus]|uniref:DNA repair-scaffolding protein-like isoform X4 n=1 Tax=Physeter macrocephalus TaxID=9755 RepID=A0A455B089_PHYMC|nr:DNA repair-scaffolding protein-like isoform X4 [Physeter catodon]|eukprot:XP_028342197.1 DNA repair-scaffolding protein-like isoform X4 [Physeter catodon]
MLVSREKQHNPSLTGPSRETAAPASKEVFIKETIYINSVFESFNNTFMLYFCLHFKQETTHLPPPSFCYILTAHPNLGQIDAIEEDSISKLYQPPIPRFLREILQTDGPCTRCSFYARVIYQRPQVNSLLLEPREMWLVVTDVTLQTQDEGSGLPRTVPVRVAPSCVLGQEVRDTLSEATSQSFFFRDALRDQGQVVCVGRTVLLLPKPQLGVASGAWELTSPVRLDELDSVTRVNSICSVQVFVECLTLDA